jgi:hypothetical protein
MRPPSFVGIPRWWTEERWEVEIMPGANAAPTRGARPAVPLRVFSLLAADAWTPPSHPQVAQCIRDGGYRCWLVQSQESAGIRCRSTEASNCARAPQQRWSPTTCTTSFRAFRVTRPSPSSRWASSELAASRAIRGGVEAADRAAPTGGAALGWEAIPLAVLRVSVRAEARRVAPAVLATEAPPGARQVDPAERSAVERAALVVASAVQVERR